MDTNDDKRRELIARAIAAGVAIDADGGEAWLTAWRQLAVHLSPLIGDSGFAALYRRTVRLVSTEHDWLGSSPPSSTSEELLLALRKQFAEVDPAMAREADIALLTIFTQLLCGLIGEALTIRLLNAAWNAPENANAREQS